MKNNSSIFIGKLICLGVQLKMDVFTNAEFVLGKQMLFCLFLYVIKQLLHSCLTINWSVMILEKRRSFCQNNMKDVFILPKSAIKQYDMLVIVPPVYIGN